MQVKCCKAGELLADSNASPGGDFVGVIMSGCVAVVTLLTLGGDGGEGSGEKMAPGVGGERADARRRSQQSGMQRKRLVTEGPVMLPAKHGRAPGGVNDLIRFGQIWADLARLLWASHLHHVFDPRNLFLESIDIP